MCAVQTSMFCSSLIGSGLDTFFALSASLVSASWSIPPEKFGGVFACVLSKINQSTPRRCVDGCLLTKVYIPPQYVVCTTIIVCRPDLFASPLLCGGRGVYPNSTSMGPFIEGPFPRPDTFFKTPYHNGITTLLR